MTDNKLQPYRAEELENTARQKAMMEREEHRERYPGDGREPGTRKNFNDMEEVSEEAARRWVKTKTREILEGLTERLCNTVRDS